MAKDDPLRSKLASLATASQGRVTFNVRTSRELGTEFDVDLGTSTNPVYDFTVTPTSGSPFRCVAYTNLVDASKHAYPVITQRRRAPKRQTACRTRRYVYECAS